MCCVCWHNTLTHQIITSLLAAKFLDETDMKLLFRTYTQTSAFYLFYCTFFFFIVHSYCSIVRLYDGYFLLHTYTVPTQISIPPPVSMVFSPSLPVCPCDPRGLDQYCDPLFGTCNCLPNVEGDRCDRCSPGFFNITTGVGCSECNCNPMRAVDANCHQV